MKTSPVFKRQSFNHFSHTIAVVSSKGGVGKSSVTALLAVAFARLGWSVGILDADILGPSIPGMFGVQESLYSEDGKIIPYSTPLGIAIVSSQMLLQKRDEPMVYRAPIVLDLIRQLYEDTYWGQRQILLIDMPPGTGDTAMTVFQSIPMNGAIMITTPQERVREIVAKGINMLKLVQTPLLGVIENYHHYVCSQCGQKHPLFSHSINPDFFSTYQTSCLATLPLNPNLSFSLDNGTIESFTMAEVETLVAHLVKEVLR